MPLEFGVLRLKFIPAIPAWNRHRPGRAKSSVGSQHRKSTIRRRTIDHRPAR